MPKFLSEEEDLIHLRKRGFQVQVVDRVAVKLAKLPKRKHCAICKAPLRRIGSPERFCSLCIRRKMESFGLAPVDAVKRLAQDQRQMKSDAP